MEKRLLGALALLFCLVDGIQAQSDELNGFGIKAGLNLVTMHFSGGGGLLLTEQESPILVYFIPTCCQKTLLSNPS